MLFADCVWLDRPQSLSPYWPSAPNFNSFCSQARCANALAFIRNVSLLPLASDRPNATLPFQFVVGASPALATCAQPMTEATIRKAAMPTVKVLIFTCVISIEFIGEAVRRMAQRCIAV